MGDKFYEYFFKDIKDDWGTIKTYLYTLTGPTSVRSVLIGLVNEKFDLKTVDAICYPVGNNSDINDKYKFKIQTIKYVIRNGIFQIKIDNLVVFSFQLYETINNI